MNETQTENIAVVRRGRREPIRKPAALQAKVERAAKIIAKHQKVLGTVGIDALRVATLQVVAQHLADLQALLQANGFSATPIQRAAPAPTGPTCALCGGVGIYQSKSARVPQGKQRPWYCRDHAGPFAAEDREAATIKMPAAPEGAPNIQAAMAALSGTNA